MLRARLQMVADEHGLKMSDKFGTPADMDVAKRAGADASAGAPQVGVLTSPQLLAISHGRDCVVLQRALQPF